MASPCYRISRQEEKQRKRWLQVTIFSFVICPTLILALLGILCVKSRTCGAGESFFLGFFIPPLLINLWIIWHCAYRKHGTALLTWELAGLPLYFLYSLSNTVGESFNPWTFGFLILHAAIWTPWFVLSLRLRRINKKIQAQKEGCREYLEKVYELRKASSLKDLDIKFSRIIKEWPRFEPASSEEYKLKKKQFSKKGKK